MENTPEKLQMSESRLIFIIGVVQFINILDFMMVMPLGPDFARALGITVNHIGYIAGAYTLSAAISGFVAALFLDKFQRKTALCFTLGGLILATALGAAAWNGTSLLLARVIAGMFGGPLSAISLAIISDQIPPQRRGSAMGKVMGSFAVASIAGVPFGLEIARLFGWRSPFLSLSAGAAIILFFISYKLILPKRAIIEKINIKTQLHILLVIIQNKLSLAAFASMALTMIGAFMIIPNISAHLQLNLGYPREQLGILYFFGGLTSFFGMRFTGKLIDKYSAPRLSIIFTATLITAVFFGFVYYGPHTLILLVFVGFMFSMSSRGVCTQTISSEVPPPHVRGSYMSLQASIISLSQTFGAFLSSLILVETSDSKLTGVETLGMISIIMSLIIPFLLFYIERNLKHKN
jgi:predicted MFS family arabinose efflux permease